MADDDSDSDRGSALEPVPDDRGPPVVHRLSKPCKCCLCNNSSTDKSPLLTSDKDDKWSGLRPWAKLSIILDKDKQTQVRVPEGRMCLLCLNVFRLLGYQHRPTSLSVAAMSQWWSICMWTHSWMFQLVMPVQGSIRRYGSYGEYYKKFVNVEQTDKSVHHKFLLSLEEWIKQHKSDPNRTRSLFCIQSFLTFWLSPNKRSNINILDDWCNIFSQVFARLQV